MSNRFLLAGQRNSIKKKNSCHFWANIKAPQHVLFREINLQLFTWRYLCKVSMWDMRMIIYILKMTRFIFSVPHLKGSSKGPTDLWTANLKLLIIIEVARIWLQAGLNHCNRKSRPLGLSQSWNQRSMSVKHPTSNIL